MTRGAAAGGSRATLLLLTSLTNGGGGAGLVTTVHETAERSDRYPDTVTLRLYDTATRSVRDFVPLVPGKVGIYLCGLTVQSPPHIGHLRSGVNYDVLRRWLLHSGYEVTFIRNITDIDDKILAKAVEQGAPVLVASRTPTSWSSPTATARSTCCRRPTSRGPPGTSRRCTS